MAGYTIPNPVDMNRKVYWDSDKNEVVDNRDPMADYDTIPQQLYGKEGKYKDNSEPSMRLKELMNKYEPGSAEYTTLESFAHNFKDFANKGFIPTLLGVLSGADFSGGYSRTKANNVEAQKEGTDKLVQAGKEAKPSFRVDPATKAVDKGKIANETLNEIESGLGVNKNGTQFPSEEMARNNAIKSNSAEEMKKFASDTYGTGSGANSKKSIRDNFDKSYNDKLNSAYDYNRGKIKEAQDINQSLQAKSSQRAVSRASKPTDEFVRNSQKSPVKGGIKGAAKGLAKNAIISLAINGAYNGIRSINDKQEIADALSAVGVADRNVLLQMSNRDLEKVFEFYKDDVIKKFGNKN